MKAVVAALLMAVCAFPAVAGSLCDQESIDSLLAAVARAKAQAPVIESFSGEDAIEAHDRCADAARERVQRGKHDNEALVCVPQPGENSDLILDHALSFGRKIMKPFGCDLEALDPEQTQNYCDALNGCMFELAGDEARSALSERLRQAWDGLECLGE